MLGDSRVISCRASEDLRRKRAAQFKGGVSCLTNLIRHNRIIGWVNYYGDAFMILGGAPQHRRSADIDVFYGFRKSYSRLRNGLFKRIKVYHYEIDGFNPVFHGGSLVLRVRPYIEQTTMHFWMQCFDAAIEHLRITGIGAQVSNRETSLAEGLRRSAG